MLRVVRVVMFVQCREEDLVEPACHLLFSKTEKLFVSDTHVWEEHMHCDHSSEQEVRNVARHRQRRSYRLLGIVACLEGPCFDVDVGGHVL